MDASSARSSCLCAVYSSATALACRLLTRCSFVNSALQPVKPTSIPRQYANRQSREGHWNARATGSAYIPRTSAIVPPLALAHVRTRSIQPTSVNGRQHLLQGGHHPSSIDRSRASHLKSSPEESIFAPSRSVHANAANTRFSVVASRMPLAAPPAAPCPRPSGTQHPTQTLAQGTPTLQPAQA